MLSSEQRYLPAARFPQAQESPITFWFSMLARSQVHSPAGRAPKTKLLYLLSDVEGECELTAGASWTSNSIFSSLLVACAVHRRLLAARTGRLLSTNTVVALAAAGAWLDHVGGY